MNNIDQILIFLSGQVDPALEKYLSKRDAQVLRSLTKIVLTPAFITENQSRLILKILKENVEKLPALQHDIKSALASPTWSKSFRQVSLTKTLSIITNSFGEQQLAIEFTFSSAVRKVLQEISKNLTNFIVHANGKTYYADLTEINIVLLVEHLHPLGFEIDEKLQIFYDTIKSWSKTEVEKQFHLTNITHQNFQKNITSDLGLETSINKEVIIDRSMRYQYFYEKPEKSPENLVEKLAHRTTSRVWVDKNEYTVDQIVESLVALKRFPLLVVFDSHNTKNCFKELSILTKSLERIGISDRVGIYFRLNNDAAGKEFNQFIADKQLNAQLDLTTEVVGVQSGKIPKFLLGTNWKPMSVLSIGNQLRHSKTAIYANCCDLIITYTETQPIIETRVQWE
jgi:hypothetical protein